MRQDVDATPLFKGLPDDRCPCPHWGYVFKGRLTFQCGDREEIFEAGDAFYLEGGHVPTSPEPGTEYLLQPQRAVACRERGDDAKHASHAASAG